MLPKVSAFFEFKLESSFVISDAIISGKWNKDSVDTFSIILFTLGWSLNFLGAISTGSPKVAVIVPKLSEYLVIPIFLLYFESIH